MQTAVRRLRRFSSLIDGKGAFRAEVDGQNKRSARQILNENLHFKRRAKSLFKPDRAADMRMLRKLFGYRASVMRFLPGSPLLRRGEKSPSTAMRHVRASSYLGQGPLRQVQGG